MGKRRAIIIALALLLALGCLLYFTLGDDTPTPPRLSQSDLSQAPDIIPAPRKGSTSTPSETTTKTTGVTPTLKTPDLAETAAQKAEIDPVEPPEIVEDEEFPPAQELPALEAGKRRVEIAILAEPQSLANSGISMAIGYPLTADEAEKTKAFIEGGSVGDDPRRVKEVMARRVHKKLERNKKGATALIEFEDQYVALALSVSPVWQHGTKPELKDVKAIGGTWLTDKGPWEYHGLFALSEREASFNLSYGKTASISGQVTINGEVLPKAAYRIAVRDQSGDERPLYRDSGFSPRKAEKGSSFSFYSLPLGVPLEVFVIPVGGSFMEEAVRHTKSGHRLNSLFRHTIALEPFSAGERRENLVLEAPRARMLRFELEGDEEALSKERWSFVGYRLERDDKGEEEKAGMPEYYSDSKVPSPMFYESEIAITPMSALASQGRKEGVFSHLNYAIDIDEFNAYAIGTEFGGRFEFYFICPGYDSWRKIIEYQHIPGLTNEDIVIRYTPVKAVNMVTAEILDARTKLPLEGVKIQVSAFNSRNQTKEYITDASGKALVNLPLRGIRTSIRKAGYQSAEYFGGYGPGGEQTRLLYMVPQTKAWLRLTVTKSNSEPWPEGKVEAYAAVSTTYALGGRGMTMQNLKEAAASITFKGTGLSPGYCLASVVATGFQPWSQEFFVADDAEGEIQFSPVLQPYNTVPTPIDLSTLVRALEPYIGKQAFEERPYAYTNADIGGAMSSWARASAPRRQGSPFPHSDLGSAPAKGALVDFDATQKAWVSGPLGVTLPLRLQDGVLIPDLSGLGTLRGKLIGFERLEKAEVFAIPLAKFSSATSYYRAPDGGVRFGISLPVNDDGSYELPLLASVRYLIRVATPEAMKIIGGPRLLDSEPEITISPGGVTTQDLLAR